ncbi:MAG: hypothetical protein AB4063_19565 [Crocosphaera sp.]
MGKIFVDDSGNGDFLTIAEAIAVAKRDDNIIVTGGEDNVHQEADIIIDKRVTIQSDSDGATIDAQGKGRVFLIDDGDATSQFNVELKNLTLTGGNSKDIGGAILNKEKLTIKNTVITGNTAQLRGGGIYNDDGNLFIKDSVVKENRALQASGGSISNTGRLEVRDTIIENNIASAGGGIANAGKAIITDSVIKDHTSFVAAGIYNLGGKLTVERNSVISDNVALIDGAGILNVSGLTKIQKSDITDNQANGQGGGVFSFDGTLKLEKSEITGNSATFGDSDVLELDTFILGTPEKDVLTGTVGNDQIVSLDEDDVIDGLEGDDLLFGNGGADTFVLRADQGQDFIADFMDGQDFLGLSDGLTFEQLTFSGQNINFGDQTLAVLTGVDTTTLTSQDFVVM